MIENSQKRVESRRGGLRFGEGQPNNKGGRPKGLMQMARAATKDGKLLVDFALGVLAGKETQTRYDMDGTAYEVTPSIKDRLQAMEWLADRGFGKSVETHTLQNPDGSAIRQTLIIALSQAIARGEVSVRDITPPCESKRLESSPSASESLPKSVGNGNGHV